MGRRRKAGFSFSWRRASGVSALKGRISRKTGIPLTRAGRQRKVGKMLGCCVTLGVAGVAIAAALAAAVCLATHARGAVSPATRPAAATTTAPSEDQWVEERDRAAARVATAQWRLEDERARALSALKATPAVRAAAADAEAKRAALELARKGGTPQERLDASGAYVRANEAMKRMLADGVGADRGVAAAAGELRAAQEAAGRAQRALDVEAAGRAARERAAEDADPIMRAIVEKRLAVGMTLEQAKRALADWASVSKVAEQEGGVEIYEWVHYTNRTPPTPAGSKFVYGMRATFVDGKLVSYVTQ